MDSYFESLSSTLNRGWAPLRGLLRGGRKYIALPLPEAYDLPADPGETRNLVDTERAAARQAFGGFAFLSQSQFRCTFIPFQACSPSPRRAPISRPRNGC